MQNLFAEAFALTRTPSRTCLDFPTDRPPCVWTAISRPVPARQDARKIEPAYRLPLQARPKSPSPQRVQTIEPPPRCVRHSPANWPSCIGPENSRPPRNVDTRRRRRKDPEQHPSHAPGSARPSSWRAHVPAPPPADSSDGRHQGLSPRRVHSDKDGLSYRVPRNGRAQPPPDSGVRQHRGPPPFPSHCRSSAPPC